MATDLTADYVYGGPAEGTVASGWSTSASSASSTIDPADFNPNGGAAVDGTDQWCIFRNSLTWTSNAGGATLVFRNASGFQLLAGSGDEAHVGVEFLSRSAADAPFSLHLVDMSGNVIGRRRIVSGTFVSSGMPAFRYDLVGELAVPAGSVIRDIVFTDLSGAARTRTSIDELRFVRKRRRSHPGIPYYPLRRARNEWTGFAPVLWKPTNDPIKGTAIRPHTVGGGTPGFDGYYALIDGNCSGNEESIIEWASMKWWGPGNVVDGVDYSAGILAAMPASIQGTPANWLRAFKAEGWKESTWRVDLPGDWETYNWPPYNDVNHKGYQSRGFFQLKTPRFWVPYPHPFLSLAWGADFLGAMIRAHFDGALATASNANFKLDGSDGASVATRFRRAVNCYFAGSPAASQSEQGGNTPQDGANSNYVCDHLGGTVVNPYEAGNGTNYDATASCITLPWTGLNGS